MKTASRQWECTSLEHRRNVRVEIKKLEMFNARNIQIGEEGTLLMETKKDGPRGRRKKTTSIHYTKRTRSFKERAGTPVNSYIAVKSNEE